MLQSAGALFFRSLVSNGLAPGELQVLLLNQDASARERLPLGSFLVIDLHLHRDFNPSGSLPFSLLVLGDQLALARGKATRQ